MSHLKLGSRQQLSTYRKIAIATWRHPRDPSTYSWLDLPTDAAEAFLAAYPSDEVRPSLTHYIAKIIAYCLEKHPQLNQVLRGGNLYPRTQTDLYLTALTKGRDGFDLSGITIRNVPKMDMAEFARRAKEGAENVRRGTDPATNRTDSVTKPMPAWLVDILARLQDFCHFGLNISLAPLGIPDDRFGSAIVSNFGVLGLENGLVPLSPYCRCPLMVGIGKSRPLAIVKDGAVVAADCVNVSFTFDHRYGDGAHGAQMLRLFEKIFLDPGRYPHVFANV